MTVSTETKRFNEIHPNRGTVEPEHKMTGPHQTNEMASFQLATQLQDIPARKAELIQAVKARKKAHYRADEAARKEDLKACENIALMVWCRGMTGLE